MKNLFLIAASLTLAIGAHAGAPDVAKKSVKEEKKTTDKGTAKLLVIDPAVSTVHWTGKKVSGTHTGSVPLRGGHIEVKPDGKIMANVVVDLEKLTDEDVKDAEYNKKLVDHLKSDAFFDTAKFPTATYKIDSIDMIKGAKAGEPNAIAKGDLTIRGVTKPYETKFIYNPTDKGADIKGKITIDRTAYGLKYNSGKFFDPKTLGDKLINDIFEVDLNLVAMNHR